MDLLTVFLLLFFTLNIESKPDLKYDLVKDLALFFNANVKCGSSDICANIKVELLSKGQEFKSKTVTLVDTPDNITNSIYLIPNINNLPALRFDSDVFLYELEGESSFKLYEVYSIKGGNNKLQWFGNWNQSVGLHIPIVDKWERRNDFGGIRLVNAAVDWPFLMKQSKDSTEDATGFYPEIVSYLAKSLNFSIAHIEPEDGLFGGQEENGSWNGLIKMLQDNEADLSGTGLAVSLERATAVDFLQPIIRDYISLFGYPQNAASNDLMAFIAILHWKIWLCVLIFSILVSWLLYNKYPDKSQYKTDLWNSFATVYMGMLQLDNTICTRATSRKFLVLTTRLTMFFIFSAYCGILTSTMTFQPPSPIKSVQDAMDRGLQLVIGKDTFNEALLKTSPKGHPFRKLYEEQVLSNPKHRKNVWSEVIESITNYHHHMGFAATLSQASVPGSVMFDIKEKVYMHLSIAVPKESEFLEVFEYNMLKLRQTGVLRKVTKNWIPDQAKTSCGCQVEAYTLGLNNLLFLIATLSTGILMGILIFLKEYFCRKVKQ